MQRLMTAQQNEARKLNEQVGALTSTLDTLRQSFASTSATDDKPAAREQPRRSRSAPRPARAVQKMKIVVQRKRPRGARLTTRAIAPEHVNCLYSPQHRA